jgi:GntR family transcriptional regulator/MocR family aminotransferase
MLASWFYEKIHTCTYLWNQRRAMDYRFLLAADLSSPKVSRQRQLYTNLRAAIAAGRLAAHHRLPGSRELAEQLGIARNTVIYAFEQLGAEGYLHSSRRGTVVAKIPDAVKARGGRSKASFSLSQRIRAVPNRERPQQDPMPFTPGVPALNEFPLQEWHLSLRRAGMSMRPADLGYGDARGNVFLREAISDRLRAARGLRCTRDQVFITNGTQATLDLLARSLADVGDTVWVESPGYTGARAAFTAAGLLVEAMPVDDEGVDVENLGHLIKPRFIYVTPSHQYPLGSVLSLRRRMDVINLARRVGAMILEDDYDSDFRFGGEPLPALQGLVEEAPVMYLGTFSKTMFPGLRLGYFVVPNAAIEPIDTIYANLDRHGRQLEQLALARFMADGRYTRHLSRMRKLYRERQDLLRAALAVRLPKFEVRGAEAGLHLVLRFPDGVDDLEFVRRARRQGLNPGALSSYCGDVRRKLSGLVLGYGNLATAYIESHVATLAALCKRLT